MLHKPAQDERAAIDEAIERALEVLPLVLAGDLQGAMLKLHSQQPVEPAAGAREARASAEKPESAAQAAKEPADKARPARESRASRREARKPRRPRQPEPKSGRPRLLLLKKFLPGTDPARKK